jgi:hypothetical protein
MLTSKLANLSQQIIIFCHGELMKSETGWLVVVYEEDGKMNFSLRADWGFMREKLWGWGGGKEMSEPLRNWELCMTTRAPSPPVAYSIT